MATNIITLGYGFSDDPSEYSTLFMTFGLGDATATPPLILTGRFQLDSAEYPSALTLRVRFTAPPNFGTGSSGMRADVAANYTLTGPGGGPVPTILVAGAFSGDTEVADLTLSSPLLPGIYTLRVANTVTGTAPVPLALSGPNEVTFEVTSIVQGDIAGGRVTGDAEADLLSFLNPAYRKKTHWRQLMGALALGDQRQRDLASSAFDQLFVPSASGKYLTHRAAERGISRFVDVGFSEPIFRRLATSVYTRKLTQGSFLEMLESTYGTQGVRAYSQTGLAEPFVFGDGDTLSLLLDEKTAVTVTFRRANFEILRRATADEIAFHVTRNLAIAGTNAYAEAVDDPEGGRKVRIVSGLRGLLSSVRVTGGTAQPALDFATDLFPDPSPMPALPAWQISQPSDNVVRYRCLNTDLFNLSLVEAGDYLVVTGPEFGLANRGSHTILDVHFAVVGGAPEQWVDVNYNGAVPQTVTQDTRNSIRIYRATRRTVYEVPGYALVDQHQGIARVSLAATTQAVARGPGLAAYMQTQPPIDALTALRKANGVLTIETSTAHGLAVGDHFDLLGTQTLDTAPVATPGTPPGPLSADQAASGTSDGSPVTTMTLDGTIMGAGAQSVRDLDGDLWVMAESLYDGLGGTSAGSHIIRAFVSTESGGLLRNYIYGYVQRPFPSGMGVAPAACCLTWPDSLRNKMMVAGGYRTTPWADLVTLGLRDGVEVLRKMAALQEVLVTGQLSNSDGILAGLGFTLTANAQLGDLLSVSDGTTTRTYGFGTGGDVTVTIGGSAAATMTALAAAIVADGSAAWSATYAPTLTAFHANGTTVIYENAVLTSKSGLRIWGNAGLATRSQYVPFADADQSVPDYAAGVLVSLLTSNPGSGRAGFHRLQASLVDGENHLVRTGNDYWLWVEGTSSWSNFASWFDSQPSTNLAAARADATATTLASGALGAALVIGGADTLNRATNDVQRCAPTTLAVTSVGTLKQARAQHGAILLPSGRVLVVGGSRGATKMTRTVHGFTDWTFDDPIVTATFDGPVLVTPNIGNERCPGKIGYGVRMTTGAMNAVTGAPQTALNAILLAGNYTVAGWFTSGQGVIIKNGIAGVWAAAADNTLLELGVDPADDLIFLRYQRSSGTVQTFKTVLTRTALMGPTPAAGSAPRYHQIVLTCTNTTGTGTWCLYVDGVERSATWTALMPTSGTNGVWQFGGTDGAIPRFAGCIDVWGITGTYITTATDVRTMYQEEVGVLHDNPYTVDSPIGRVHNSCEEVTDAGVATLVAPMAWARSRPGLAQLPDGRVVVVGGLGYPVSAPTPELSAPAAELRSAEIYDPATKLWNPAGSTRDPHSGGLCAYDAATDRVYVAGGYTSQRVEYLDCRDMTWHVSPASLVAARSQAAGGLVGDSVVAMLGGASRNANGFLLTTMGGSTAAPGPELVRAGRLTGRYRAVTGTMGTTIVAQAEAGMWTSAEGGQVWPVPAPANTGFPGPFVFDPTGGFGLGSVSGELAITLEEGRRYADITLSTDEALPFGHEPGYVVFNFGYADQVGPVKHLGRSGADTLMIDADFRFPNRVPAGSTVTAVTQKAPYVPEDMTGVGGFYVTGSAAGRIATQQLLKEMSAGGIDLEVEVRWPGDRGLASEGFPTKDSYKISGIVECFSGDHLEVELEEARGTET